MAIYFMGGEDIDFSPLGTVSVNGAGGNFRANYARCALAVNGGQSLANGWAASFSSAASAFWTGMRVLPSTTGLAAAPAQPFYALFDGTALRLGLAVTTGNTLALVSYNNAGQTQILATSASGAVPTTLCKIDLYVAYGTNGQVRVFVNQTEVITFNGDLTAGTGSTTLSRHQLASSSNDSSQTFFSEIFVTDRDSRTLMMVTHAPTSDVSGNQWSGSFGQINEMTADEASVISTSSNDSVSSFGVNPLPSNAQLAIRGFKVSGYAARGETGPQHIDLGVVTGGQSVYSADLSVDTGWTRIGQVYETNPVTNTGWTSTDINSIEISVKSRA